MVLAAAAVLSFDALRHLALAVGIGPGLAWLLPLCVDAGAAVSCAVWLGRRAHLDAARVAGRMTLALLAVTVGGNAAQLGMAAHHITPPWWVAVAVGAIPPAVVGATVHLVVLLVRGPAPVQQPAEPAQNAAMDAAVGDSPPPETATAPAHEPAPVPAGPPTPAATSSAGETADERRRRAQRDRATRNRRHKAGQHDLCDPARCSDARPLHAVRTVAGT